MVVKGPFRVNMSSSVEQIKRVSEDNLGIIFVIYP